MIEPLLKPGVKEGREVKTQRQMQAARLKRWNEGERTCSYCHRPILDFNNYCLDHIVPGKMGGCKNDADSNLAPIHIYPCNGQKGSRRK